MHEIIQAGVKNFKSIANGKYKIRRKWIWIPYEFQKFET
jgi:hypothetical protein